MKTLNKKNDNNDLIDVIEQDLFEFEGTIAMISTDSFTGMLTMSIYLHSGIKEFKKVRKWRNEKTILRLRITEMKKDKAKGVKKVG